MIDEDLDVVTFKMLQYYIKINYINFIHSVMLIVEFKCVDVDCRGLYNML